MGMLNVGQKVLKENALAKYAIAPAVTGGVVGTGYGVYDQSTNKYADYKLSNYATKGALIGLGVGGVAATTGRTARDYKVWKNSRYTNADDNLYGLSSNFSRTLANM